MVAVDVGTTATKAAVVDDGGAVLGAAEFPHPTASREPSWVEQDPDHWWASTRSAVRDAVAQDDTAEVVALAVTGQMQDVIAVDGERCLRPAILYSDTRAVAEHRRLCDELGETRWARVTGNVQDPSNVAAKWLWLAAHEPEVLRETKTLLLGGHSYVVWRASGAAVCDATTASTTGLLDLRGGRWAEPVLEAAGIDGQQLPALVQTAEVVGNLSEQAAAELGLAAGTAVIHTPGDAATTTVGVGAASPGVRYVYLGTSGWVAGTFVGLPREPMEQLYALNHALDGVSLRIGPMLSVGSCLDWALEALSVGGHADVEAAMSSTAPGPSPVIFLPYLGGERAPYRDADARGAFIGLSHSVAKAHLVRSVVEGVCYALRSIDEFLGTAPSLPLLVCGGGAQSDSWCQTLADIVGRQVVRTDFSHAGVLGAAMTAGDVLGWCDLAQNTWPEDRPRQSFFPRDHDGYVATYEVFRGLYPVLRSSFRALARREEERNSAQR